LSPILSSKKKKKKEKKRTEMSFFSFLMEGGKGLKGRRREKISKATYS
jgi:hypothetical protein